MISLNISFQPIRFQLLNHCVSVSSIAIMKQNKPYLEIIKLNISNIQTYELQNAFIKLVFALSGTRPQQRCNQLCKIETRSLTRCPLFLHLSNSKLRANNKWLALSIYVLYGSKIFFFIYENSSFLLFFFDNGLKQPGLEMITINILIFLTVFDSRKKLVSMFFLYFSSTASIMKSKLLLLTQNNCILVAALKIVPFLLQLTPL